MADANARPELKNLKSLSPTLTSTFDRKNVKQAIANGLRMTFLSTTATLTTNFLNAYMTHHGMESRVFTVTLQPNTQRPTPVNPLRKVTGGSFQ